jgi:hypothetical protein
MISQDKADSMFQSQKILCQQNLIEQFPLNGGNLCFNLTDSDTRKEIFQFDVRNYGHKTFNFTYQNRYQRENVLRRLDLTGPPHRNPDSEPPNGIFTSNELIETPHMHFYYEGWGERWAISANKFQWLTGDEYEIAIRFALYCNIVNPQNFLVSTQLNFDADNYQRLF